MLVFARYVMFSEVYWHHAVRAATAMLQRAFYLLYTELDLDALFRLNEQQMVEQLRMVAGSGPAGELLEGLCGSTRRLYKRLAQYSFFEQRELYLQLRAGPTPGWPPVGMRSRILSVASWDAASHLTRFCSMRRPCSWRSSSTSMSSFPRSAVIGRWGKSPQSSRLWLRSSSMTT